MSDPHNSHVVKWCRWMWFIAKGTNNFLAMAVWSREEGKARREKL